MIKRVILIFICSACLLACSKHSVGIGAASISVVSNHEDSIVSSYDAVLLMQDSILRKVRNTTSEAETNEKLRCELKDRLAFAIDKSFEILQEYEEVDDDE